MRFTTGAAVTCVVATNKNKMASRSGITTASVTRKPLPDKQSDQAQSLYGSASEISLRGEAKKDERMVRSTGLEPVTPTVS
ncbi:MAG: hypothetical protein OSB55_08420, partial [Verrucomicrobiota bacterium]|nr:hypothetical protein [Verrucomicrobiota bacterium]